MLVPSKQTETGTIFKFGYQYLAMFWSILLTKHVLVVIGPNSGIDLIVVLEYYCFLTFFQHRTNLLGSQDSEEAM